MSKSVAITFEVAEAHRKMICALALEGKSTNAISKQTKLSKGYVEKVMNSEEFKELVSHSAETIFKQAKYLLQTGMAERAPLMLEVLDHHLKSKNLHAVTISLQMMGLHTKDTNEKQGSTNIQVIMPGMGPQEIEVKSDVE